MRDRGRGETDTGLEAGSGGADGTGTTRASAGRGWLVAAPRPAGVALAVLLTAAVLVGLAFAPRAVEARQPADELQARVWLDRGEEPVLSRGDRVRVYYRTNRDAYLSIVRIDTDGRPHVLFPASPDVPHFVRGDRDYRLLFPRTAHWPVEDDPGIGYLFVVASPWPLDFSRFGWSAWGGWDVRRVSDRIYSDPYLAMDDFVEALIPGWEYDPYALDFSAYHVEEQWDYPRFLCYDCHTTRPFSSWNPYGSSCSTFQIVIYDDPWYSPAYRYRGTTVVWTRPPVRNLPRYTFRDLPTGRPNVPMRIERATAVAGGGAPVASPRRSTSGIGSGGTRGVVSTPRTTRPGSVRSETARPGGTPAPKTRPSAGVPRRAVPSAGGGTRATPPTRGTPGTVRGAPPSRGSGSVGSSRPPTRGSGGTARSSGPTRSSGSAGPARPPARSGGSVGSSRPPTRGSGGSVGSSRPPTRGSGGSVGSSRPPTRGGGSVGRSRPPTRGSGGSGGTRPPTRRGGGGGAGGV